MVSSKPRHLLHYKLVMTKLSANLLTIRRTEVATYCCTQCKLLQLYLAQSDTPVSCSAYFNQINGIHVTANDVHKGPNWSMLDKDCAIVLVTADSLKKYTSVVLYNLSIRWITLVIKRWSF